MRWHVKPEGQSLPLGEHDFVHVPDTHCSPVLHSSLLHSPPTSTVLRLSALMTAMVMPIGTMTAPSIHISNLNFFFPGCGGTTGDAAGP
jgi:hypothetical protein